MVVGDADAIRVHFAALCPLQPVRMTPQGLVCAPRSAPEVAGPALAACPLPVRALDVVPAWPDPPAGMVGGWYRRSPGHLPAPTGIRELVQVGGEGFGPGDHATTAMCLEALDALAPGPALDAGCGSGLLAQAWAALGRGPVIAVDLDPRALAQARASLAAAGLAGVDLRRGPLSGLSPAGLAGRVVLANVPAPAHHDLLGRADPGAPPAAAVLSGIRPAEVPPLVAAWDALGLGVTGEDRRGGFVRLSMRA